MPRPDMQRRSLVRKSRNSQPPRFALGLDLGQSHDYTALIAVEQLWELKEAGWEPGEACIQLQAPEYHVRHIERFPLGTAYTTIVQEVEDTLLERPLAGRTRLVVDGTGVGAPVVDMFLNKGAQLLPVSITSGDAISYNGRTVRVPKRNLVSVLQILFQSKRLRIGGGLTQRDALLAELRNFSAKITTRANDTYEAWREGQHDDLVLALALACWSFERATGSPRVRLGVSAFSGSGAIFRS